jgi:hypothetical protein
MCLRHTGAESQEILLSFPKIISGRNGGAARTRGTNQPLQIRVLHGDPGEIGRSRIPMALTRGLKTGR